jgi:hypothetical protein
MKQQEAKKGQRDEGEKKKQSSSISSAKDRRGREGKQ